MGKVDGSRAQNKENIWLSLIKHNIIQGLGLKDEASNDLGDYLHNNTLSFLLITHMAKILKVLGDFFDF